jgi:hypothetical protein
MLEHYEGKDLWNFNEGKESVNSRRHGFCPLYLVSDFRVFVFLIQIKFFSFILKDAFLLWINLIE